MRQVALWIIFFGAVIRTFTVRKYIHKHARTCTHNFYVTTVIVRCISTIYRMFLGIPTATSLFFLLGQLRLRSQNNHASCQLCLISVNSTCMCSSLVPYHILTVPRACMLHATIFIIESVDSIGRDGPDTPIYVIHYKKPKISEQVRLWNF